MFRLIIFSCLFLATLADSNSQAQPTDGRIVGGKDTDITELPHQVSVQYRGFHFCGGSIVAAKYVLTAAHCIRKKNITHLSIRAGSSYYYKDGKVINVVNGTTHPYYNPLTSSHDAAVLELEESLTADEVAKIATLAHTEPKEGDMALVSGWGSMEEGKDNAEKLQSVLVPVVSRKVCQEKYRWENITAEMFCTGYTEGGKDSCNGDSGGPVMIDDKLAGIVSWGYGCGKKNYPSVNTNIAKILLWLGSFISQ